MLQLLLQLIQKAPFSALRDQFLRRVLYHPGFPQPQRIKAHRLLRVVLAPATIRKFLQRLQRVICVHLETLGEKRLCPLFGIGGANLASLEDRAYRALCCDGVLAREVAIGGNQAAEILRPRAVDCTVEQHAADLSCTQLLRIGRKTEEGVDLAVCQELLRLARRMGRPLDVPIWIEPDRGCDTGEKNVL
jgi:hypothetical protein